MSTKIQALLPEDWRPGRAAAAGLAATITYSVAMENDKYITGNHFNDVTFIQGLFGNKDASSNRFRALSWGLHFLNGALLAEVYAVICKRCPRPALPHAKQVNSGHPAWVPTCS